MKENEDILSDQFPKATR